LSLNATLTNKPQITATAALHTQIIIMKFFLLKQNKKEKKNQSKMTIKCQMELSD